ncbi:MAG: phosphoglucosamine mutase [Deltaproteobacteria bacterium]|nr:phosphoglucosamine mutase [Deltaproteobacteria bacterium]
MIRFGTDGIRGETGEHPITAEVAARVGRAASALAGGGPVLVARDTRPGGEALASAVLDGAAVQGSAALDLGVLPTSGLAAALAGGLGAAGVMITASHNPATDNGFKVLGAGGRKLSEAQTARVEAWLENPPPAGISGSVRAAADPALAIYLRALVDALPALGAVRGPVVIDLANGALTSVRPWMEALPFEVILIGGGDGQINEGVGSEHLEHLGAAVRATGARAGLAVDGDADRCRLVDAEGAPLAGDAVTWLLARGAGAIAVTVMSNAGLEASMPGVRVLRTPVGDKHLLEALAADPTLAVGAEESGHVVFPDALPTGDGLVTGLRALALVGDQPLRDAVSGYRAFPRCIRKVRVTQRPELDTVPGVAAAREEGLALLGQGRVFLRYSGTEPVLRVLVEGPEQALVDEVTARVCAAAQAALS